MQGHADVAIVSAGDETVVDDSDEAAGLPAVIEQAAASVPEGLKAKAIKTIGRLVGAGFFPTKYRQARDQLDLMEGRSIISRALAEEVAVRARNDPKLLERATVRFLGEAGEKQENREAIALLTYQELANSNDEPADEPTPEWMWKFSAYAEEVSVEEMQRLWARILAGEIRKPGSFSLKSLRFMAELDREVAEVFRQISRHELAGNALFAPPESWSSGTPYLQMKMLVEAGLLVEPPGQSRRVAQVDGQNSFVWGREHGLVIKGAVAPYELPIALLTKVGRELLPLVGPIDERENLRDIWAYLAAQGSTSNVSEAFIGRKFERGDQTVVNRDEVLWKAD